MDELDLSTFMSFIFCTRVAFRSFYIRLLDNSFGVYLVLEADVVLLWGLGVYLVWPIFIDFAGNLYEKINSFILFTLDYFIKT